MVWMGEVGNVAYSAAHRIHTRLCVDLIIAGVQLARAHRDRPPSRPVMSATASKSGLT